MLLTPIKYSMHKPKFRRNLNNQKGVGLIEIIIVLLVLAIILVLALPQLNSSRKLFRYAGMQREMVTLLREARQEAVGQRRAITFTYDDANKSVIFSGGKFGTFGASANRTHALTGGGLQSPELVYGRPSSAPSSHLADKTNLTSLTNGKIDITFQSDGSVVDAANNPQNIGMFFYGNSDPDGSAFAVSVLGAGGRVKLWRYVQANNAYVE